MLVSADGVELDSGDPPGVEGSEDQTQDADQKDYQVGGKDGNHCGSSGFWRKDMEILYFFIEKIVLGFI